MSVMKWHDKVLQYTDYITIPDTKEIKEIILYCEPIRFKQDEIEITEYHIMEIFNVSKYLDGDRSDCVCKETIFTKYNVPQNLKSFLSAIHSRK